MGKHVWTPCTGIKKSRMKITYYCANCHKKGTARDIRDKLPKECFFSPVVMPYTPAPIDGATTAQGGVPGLVVTPGAGSAEEKPGASPSAIASSSPEAESTHSTSDLLPLPVEAAPLFEQLLLSVDAL